MSKRYGNIFPQITNIDNIKKAHRMARQDKSSYSAVKKTDKYLEERIKIIQDMLINHSYRVSMYKTSIIQDKGKKRILYKLPYYPDRIIQWAIMLQIEPIFMEVFTDFTCASIKHRGIHQASSMLDKWLNTDIEGTKYCLKFDIKKFYPSIDRAKLKQLLLKKIKDKDLIIELNKIIDSMENSNIDKLPLSEEEKYWYTRPGKGLPIGSYLSQYLANYYLAYFDHWLKEELHCKYVIRYMDDIVILSDSKEFLWNVFFKSKNYLKEELDLTIKENYQVFPVDDRGIDFVGFRHFRSYKLLRKSSFKNAKNIANKIIYLLNNKKYPTEKEYCGWISNIGWISWCDSEKFYRKYFLPGMPLINAYYITYKRGKKRSINRRIYNYNDTLKLHKKYYGNFKHKKLHKEAT